MTKSTGATGDDKLIGDGDKDQNDLDQKRLNMDEGLKHGDIRSSPYFRVRWLGTCFGWVSRYHYSIFYHK